MRPGPRRLLFTPSGCNKVGYDTEREARNVAKKQRRRPGLAGAAMRAYLCLGCPKWHLTSQGQKTLPQPVRRGTPRATDGQGGAP